MKKKIDNKNKIKKVAYHKKPLDMTMEEWQIALRRQFACKQNFKFKNIGKHLIFSDFSLTNPETDKTYKVAIRSEHPGLNFCSCPDFAVNMLGTCKHIEFLLYKLKNKRGAKKIFEKGFEQPFSAVFLKYGRQREIVLYIGKVNSEKIKKLSKKYFNSKNCLLESAFDIFEKFIEKAVKLDPDFECYKDAMDYLIEIRDNHKRKKIIEKSYSNGFENQKIDNLLNAKLYPYQKEGILFAAKSGRALIADDMGLGKTIQALGVAELLARELGIDSVLIICPTSLKYQWQHEIEKFLDRTCLVLEGAFLKRSELYEKESFFKIISYNTVRNDLESIEKLSPDLVILDEAQRIKNWKTKTAQGVKAVNSPYALVLTGTPLENRLEELHSIVEFIDKYKLGALFRFLDNHQVKDEAGKVVGYRKLKEIKETLSDILIRRRKKEVLPQLPPRIDKTYFVPVTETQIKIHEEYYTIVAKLVHKWRKLGFLPEKDRQILLISLNCMRMVSNTTYILDQKTDEGNKIDELLIFLKEFFENKGEKIVIFSQWERMTRLVAKELERLKVQYEYLHGGIPSNKRAALLENFRENSKSLVFLSTDAGGVGLNLQSASTVINLDCPWNPAVLEQRIGRVHRLGQHNPVNVINFISKGTIEERMLGLIKFKKSLFDGVLDNGATDIFMDENKMQRFMKTVETLTKSEDKKIKEPEKKQEFEIKGLEQVVSNSKELKEKNQDNAISDLFITGLSFLEKLSFAVAKNKEVSDSSAFIKKDEKTGEQYLKIPMPKEEILEKAANVLNSFLSVLKK